MSSEVRVSFGELSAAQSNITATVNAVNGQLDDLKRFLAPMASTWEGQAAETYNALQRQWDIAAADLNQVLAQIATAVGVANEQYQAAESANTSRFV